MVWDIDPALFKIGFIQIRYYSLLFACAFLIGYKLVYKMFEEEYKPLADVESLFLTMFLSTVVGARLGHVIFYKPQWFGSPEGWWQIVKIWEGGLASHGAAIGIMTGLYIYSIKRNKEQPYLWVSDRVAPPIALAGCMIRLGNFFNSEIVGQPTDVPWAITFARLDNIPRHPTQLYESLAYLVISVILYTIYLRRKEKSHIGLLTGWFFTLIFGFRFCIEFLKKNQVSFELDMPLHMGQILSIPMVLFGIGLIIYSQTTKRTAITPKQTKNKKNKDKRK